MTFTIASRTTNLLKDIDMAHAPVAPLTQAPLGKFKHYKGGEYEVILMARHSETEEKLVVYRQLDKNTGWWVRPYDMFFGTLLVDGVTTQRFTLVEERDPVPALAL